MKNELLYKSLAIESLRPGSQFSITGENLTIDWQDPNNNCPTDSEIVAEITRLQTEWDNQDYARKRKAEYDALNQFELISNDAINGTTTHRDAILAIKAKYPKE